MSKKTIFYILFSLLFTFGMVDKASADIHNTAKTAQETQDKHNKVATQRMQYIKKRVQLSNEQEKSLNNALMSLDKMRFSIWKQSMELRNSLEKEDNLSEDEANKNLQKLLDLDKELDNAHYTFFSELEEMSFNAQERLKIYISLKNFHSRMGKSLRD